MHINHYITSQKVPLKIISSIEHTREDLQPKGLDTEITTFIAGCITSLVMVITHFTTNFAAVCWSFSFTRF